MSKLDSARAELLRLQEEAVSARDRLTLLRKEVATEEGRMWSAVSEHTALRFELMDLELEAKGLTWCTYDHIHSGYSTKVAPVPVVEVRLLFIDAVTEGRCGYEGGDVCKESIKQLHRVCKKCREYLESRHGSSGSYYWTHFYVFKAEVREDGYYANRFGNWVKLPAEIRLFEPPHREIALKGILDTLQLPLAIGRKYNGS